MSIGRFLTGAILAAVMNASGIAWSAPVTRMIEPFADVDAARPEPGAPAPRFKPEAIPEPAVAHAEAAEAAVKRGDLPAAMAALDAAIAAAPQAGELYFARARLYAWQRQGNEAVADYEKGLSLVPASVEARLELADLLAQRLNQPERALPYYQEAVKLAPDSAVAQYGLAFGLILAKRPNEAIAALQRSQELAPNNPRPALALGQIHARAGRYNEALRQFDDALRRSPGYRPALLAKADILLAMRRNDDAIAAYAAALAADPTLTAAQLGLAMAQHAAGRLKDAEQSYRRVLQSEPKQALALNGLAALLTSRNTRLDEAVELARQAVAVAGDVPEFRDTLGWALHQNNQPGAIEELERSIALRPSAIAYVHLGAARKATGQVEAARQAYRDALKLDPNYAPARIALSELNAGAPSAR
jgi:tetratricopeptide (TPR) repeat protein